jgi:GNAT superfamily N-acetyltransferase
MLSPRIRPSAPLVRDLRPGETGVLAEVFAGLSEQSRYQRFHGPKPRMTAAERAYLAAVDGRDHLAVVAVAHDGSPLGIARCVRHRHDTSAADLAAEVVDPFQRRGVGTALVARLARRAAAAGIERLTASVLAETGLQRALLRRGWRVTAVDGPALTLEAPVWALIGRRDPLGEVAATKAKTSASSGSSRTRRSHNWSAARPEA